MGSGTAGRRKPGNIIYANETKYQKLSSKSPSRHATCKCKEIVETKDDDCDKCSENEEIKTKRSLKDAPRSPRGVERSPRNKRRDLSPKERKFNKQQLLSPTKLDSPPPRGLEKSNSMTESKPVKQLRTTKSLSPRPPIKHQQQMTVSDERNVVSLKVSPAEDFGDVLKKEKKERKKAIGNDISPEGNLRLDERHNRSTSCLMYVPCDPWTKMDMKVDTKTKKKGENRMKKLMDVKSLSRPDLVDDDPWVYDESRNRDKRCATYRNTSSKSLHIDNKSGTARPRLQRSKSPAFFPDENPKNPPSTPNNLSPKSPLESMSPKLGYHSVPDDDGNTKSRRKSQNQNQFLNVSNPNLLQPRHSFSTSNSKKDDELTLNIRRLSEQIKHSSNYASYGNFPATVSPSSGEMDKKSASVLSDSLLETTC